MELIDLNTKCATHRSETRGVRVVAAHRRHSGLVSTPAADTATVLLNIHAGEEGLGIDRRQIVDGSPCACRDDFAYGRESFGLQWVSGAFEGFGGVYLLKVLEKCK